MNLGPKVSPKIEKVIRRFPTKAKIVIEEIDELYKEPTGNYIVKVPSVTGFFHEDKRSTRVKFEDKGVVYEKEDAMYLMVLITPETKTIARGDIMVINDSECYMVIEPHNPNKLDIYLDIEIERSNLKCQDLNLI